MKDFYNKKKVFVTGHTGFKGSWLCEILLSYGAEVVGYSLEPNTSPNLYTILNLDSKMKSIIGDIRDLDHLKRTFDEEKPEIVFHLAAQPIVIDSYENPVYTYETNVMGTVNLLECVRNSDCVKSVVNITTDKVYQNKEWEWGYRENDRLCGYDPYSNSKSCSELVTHSYINSFFQKTDKSISTARAGNVIGGGDFANHRIVPDCARLAHEGKAIAVRNPNSIRPYQHVLEPLYCYLMIAKEQYNNLSNASNYNIGPNESDCITTGQLTTMFCESWIGSTWESQSTDGPHEANFLKLDCSKIKSKFNWSPKWDVKTAIEKSVEWYQAYYDGEDMDKITLNQINEYLK